MTLTIADLMSHSYVLTQGGDGLRRFNEMFGRYGLLPLPAPYVGRRVDRGSREFAKNRHFIAAHVSHLEIVEQARRNGWPFVCIFEDDALPCRAVLQKLERCLRKIPDDAYLLRLGYVPFDGRFAMERTDSDIERLTSPRYIENYLGGSHAYIVFSSFYEENARMLETYRTTLSAQVGERNINHPRYLSPAERMSVWFYEWIMTPQVYRNPLQERMYSVNAADNLFVQPEYVTSNAVTKSMFEGIRRPSIVRRLLRRLSNLTSIFLGRLK